MGCRLILRTVHILQEVNPDDAHRLEHAHPGTKAVVGELHRDGIGDSSHAASKSTGLSSDSRV